MNSQNSLKNNLSDLSALSGLPSGWSWVKLGDIAKLVRGVSYKKELATKSPRENYLPIVRATNINSSLNFNDLVYVPKKLIKDEQIIKEGDVIIAMSSGSKDLVGKTAQAYADTEVGFGTFCGLLRFSSNVNKRFFGYFFQSREYRNHISKVSMGVNINNLRREHIEELIVQLPPLAEQKKIVEKIEELFSGLDRGVASLKKAKEQIKLYRQSVLAAAFSGKLTTKFTKDTKNLSDLSALSGLPNGWKWVKLGEVIIFLGSGVTPRGGRNVYKTEGIKFIRSQNVYPNRLVLEDVAYITNEIDEKMERSRVKPLDVLLNITGASIGRAANIPESFGQANVNQHVCILRTNQNEVRSKYLSLYLNSNFAQQHINRIQIGATRQALNYSQIKSFPFPLCPVSQQTQIVEEIEKRFSEADNLEKAIDESLAKSETLRQSILKQAFEGKLVYT